MNTRKVLSLSSLSLVGASAAFASSDYGPANWWGMDCDKFYTSGYGHKFAVVHVMEGYYETGTSYLQRCGVSASCHYTVNGLTDYSGDAAPGEIAQLVEEDYYGWHALCWNRHSLGTEHEGFESDPAWFTEEMYQASALLHRHMADKFGFAKDRNHIVGHNEKSSSAWCSYASDYLGIDPYCNTHGDPGPYWDWSHFMDLIQGVQNYENPPYYFDSGAQGWTSGNSMSDIAWSGTDWPGIIYADQTGNDAWYYSPETSYTGGSECSFNVGVFPQSGNTANHDMQMFFRTAAENSFSADKASPMVSYTAQNTWVRINLDVNQVWPKYYDQTITGLRLDVDNNNSGTRWIVNHIVQQASLRWRFDSSAEDWTSGNSMSDIGWVGTDWPGIIYADQTGDDPHIASSGGLNRLGGINDVIHVRVYPQNGTTANHDMQVFFATAGEDYFSQAKSMTIYYTAKDAWADLYFHVGQNGYWNSDWITQIRVDPDQANQGNRWIIDSIQVEHLTSPAAIPGPSIGEQPQMQTTSVGGSATLSVFPNGTAPFTYQWRRDGVNVSGATTQNYTISNAQLSQAGLYDVVVSNAGGSVTSAQAQFYVVNPAPTITTQPASVTKNPGETATFTVVASGATGYQWKKNGVNISGATSATLTLSNVQLSNAGFYTVVVSNSGGSVTSNQAQLVVTATAVAVGTGGGLRGLYYNNTDFSGLALSRLDGPVNFDWAAGSPSGAVGADSYSVRWTGQVEPRYSQTYTFYTTTDDGVRLWVNGVLLIDHWADQGYTEWSGTIALTAGQKYSIQMDYYENGGSAAAQLRWSSASQVKELIPASQLYRPVPVLAAIGNKTVAVNSALSVPVSLTTYDQVGEVTAFEDFESYGDGSPTDQIMFRGPGNSSTTSGFLDGGVTNYNVPTSSFPAGRSSARAMHVSWSFLTGTTDPWLRMVTYNAVTRPNPIVDITRSLWFDLYTDKGLKVGVDVRETNPTGAIGEDGGTSGTIEYVGVPSKTTGTPSAPIPSRSVGAGSWTTLKFNLPQEPAVGFTGNGILESTTGKAVLEGLALVPTGGMGVYHVYLDNFVQVQNGALTYALEAGAPAGATIDANTGVFSWTPTAGQGPGSYPITVRVTNAGSPSLSDTESFVVTVEAAPVITAQPQDQNVYPGGSATFSVTATGTAPLTYQWRKDGGVVSGATGSSYTLANAQASDSGSYSVVVTNALGSATSANAVLTVSVANSPPSFVAQPQSLTRNQGGSATFGVTVAGSVPLYYQWYLNGSAISGATQSGYTDSNVQPGDAGSYTVVATNDFGSATSDAAVLTVIVAPTITTQPVSQTVTQGGGVTFSAAASGTAPLSFQWRKGATPISGATGTSYSLSNVQSASAGTYTVVVSNGAGSVTSGNAVLTVYVPPAITTQPVGQTVAPGASVTFSVTATGNPAPTYQWRRNGVNISGATGSSYTKSNVQSADVGLYSVVVNNLLGSVTSVEASLALTGAIAFQDNFDTCTLAQWTTAASPGTELVASSEQNHTSGGSCSAKQDNTSDYMYHNFGSYSGHTKLSFYWYDDGASTKSYVEVRAYSEGSYPGSLTQVLAIGKYNTTSAPGETYDLHKYQLRVLYPSASMGWMNCETNTSGGARAAGWHKFSIERLADGTLNFTVDDVATRTVTGANAFDWNTAFIGTGSGTAAITAYFDDVVVEYFDPPSIVTQPVDQTVALGGSATFSVVGASNPQSYQWRFNGVNIAGATGASLTVNNAQAANAGSYSVAVANGVGAVASANALLLVAPVITTQPVSRTNVESSTVTFTVAAGGQTPLSYQWKKNGVNLSNGGIVSGAQTATLTLTGITEADEASYTVGVTNAAGGVLSEAAYLSVTPLAVAPVITVQPVSQAVGAGATVTFSVEATGTAPSYQWMFNGNPIAGATAAAYTRNNVQDADSGEYTVVVANVAGSVTSEPATLLINTAPSLAALADRTVHAGCPWVMTVSASDPEAPPQTLNFSLETAPAGATIDPSTGVFNWTPGSGDVGTTKTITVRVRDNGTPVQSAAQSFNVEVVAPVVIASVVVDGDTVVLTWNSIPDQTYRVQYKDNVTDAEWTDLTDVSAAESTATAVASLEFGTIPHRFFRIMVVN